MTWSIRFLLSGTIVARMVRLAGAKATAGDTFIDRRAFAPSGSADAITRPTSNIRSFIIPHRRDLCSYDASFRRVCTTAVQSPHHIRTVEIVGVLRYA